MAENNYEIIKKFYIIIIAVTALGAAVGALYYVNLGNSAGDINKYVSGLNAAFKNGINERGIIFSSLKTYLILSTIFIICAFFKPGIAVIWAFIARRGFVYGFTNAAFMGVLGRKGIYLVLLRVPEMILAISAMHILGSVCCGMAVSGDRWSKKNLIFFIIFLMISETIFCAAATAEGILTTTFMKIML